VGLVECSVVLRTTEAKAKTPVSKPPPNSIDSDAEEDISGDVHLSQSTTDTGVCIELPEGGAETTMIRKVGVMEEGAQTDVRKINDETPETPGKVETPMITRTDKGRSAIGRTGKKVTGTDKDKRVGQKTDVTPRSVVLSKFNKMMDEIDSSALL